LRTELGLPFLCDSSRLGWGVLCGNRQFTALSAIYDIASAWNVVKPLTPFGLWRKLMPYINEDNALMDLLNLLMMK
jgi:hypothetical protein